MICISSSRFLPRRRFEDAPQQMDKYLGLDQSARQQCFTELLEKVTR